VSKEKKQVIIRKVVKKGHGGHHGGSWKVAYADFVTAMMAFFMVMWILGMDESVRDAIEVYFSNPAGMEKGYSSGASPVAVGSSPVVAGPAPIRLVSRAEEERQFRDLASRIEMRLQSADGLGAIAAQVEVVVTESGLRIELVESGDGETFFGFGSASLKPAAARALEVVAADIRTSTAGVVVEGHTDSARFGTPGYSNWELSADRANAARRALQAAGLSPSRIREIRGYADHALRVGENPLDPSNRRISILLPFTSPPVADAPAEMVPGAS
jgi:chemotaxis protein MotB